MDAPDEMKSFQGLGWRVRRQTSSLLIFVFFLCTFSAAADALAIHNHHETAATSRLLMWCPGFAALLTCLLSAYRFGRSLLSNRRYRSLVTCAVPEPPCSHVLSSRLGPTFPLPVSIDHGESRERMSSSGQWGHQAFPRAGAQLATIGLLECCRHAARDRDPDCLVQPFECSLGCGHFAG